jgi:hypothetical protein
MKKWLKENIFVKDMFIYILFGAIIFYIPAWGAVILGFVTGENGYHIFAASYVALWAGPFTPTIPAIFAIAVSIKQIVKKISKGRD